MTSQPDARGHFGPYGGRYVPEVLMAPIEELETAYLAAREDPALHLRVGKIQIDDAVNVVTLEEELSLSGTAWETIDDEAVVPVMLGEPPPNYRLRHLVAHQPPTGHNPPHLRTQLGVVLHIPAQDVADADVLQLEVLS